MNPSNMNVLEQAELVIDGGDPGNIYEFYLPPLQTQLFDFLHEVY